RHDHAIAGNDRGIAAQVVKKFCDWNIKRDTQHSHLPGKFELSGAPVDNAVSKAAIFRQLVHNEYRLAGGEMPEIPLSTVGSMACPARGGIFPRRIGFSRSATPVCISRPVALQADRIFML